MTPYGKQAAGEAWLNSEQIADAFPEVFNRISNRKDHDSDAHFEALENEDLCEVRAIVATQPAGVTGTPSKVPEVMEVGLTGGSSADQLQFAKEKLGEEFSFTDCFEEGILTDVVAVTKGYGWQGVIRRFGGKLQSHKNSKREDNTETWVTSEQDMLERQSVKVDKQVTTRERVQQRVLKISNPEDASITPAGGFLHYGEIQSDYVLIKGSVPGPAKRLMRFRDAVRAGNKTVHDYDITYISTSSKGYEVESCSKGYC